MVALPANDTSVFAPILSAHAMFLPILQRCVERHAEGINCNTAEYRENPGRNDGIEHKRDACNKGQQSLTTVGHSATKSHVPFKRSKTQIQSDSTST